MLGLLNAGFPMKIVVLKGGDPENVIELGEVPGSEGDPGYGQVLEACGNGMDYKAQARQVVPAQASGSSSTAVGDVQISELFEENGCVLSESQLLQFFQDAGYGVGGANNAVIAVSNRPDVDPLPSDPTSFRFVGSDYCNF